MLSPRACRAGHDQLPNNKGNKAGKNKSKTSLPRAAEDVVKWAASDILPSGHMGTFEERKVPAKNSWPESRESASEDHTSNAGREKKFMHKGGHHSIADDRKNKKKNDSKEEKKKTTTSETI